MHNDGKETGTQINNFKKMEEIKIHLGQKEERRIQTNEERLRSLQDNIKSFNIQIIKVAKREE